MLKYLSLNENEAFNAQSQDAIQLPSSSHKYRSAQRNITLLLHSPSPMVDDVHVAAGVSSSTQLMSLPNSRGMHSNSVQRAQSLKSGTSSDDSECSSTSSYSSDREDGELKTYTDLLAEGVNDALRHFGLDTTKDLITLVSENKLDIMAAYADAQLARGVKRSTRLQKDGDLETNHTVEDSVASTAKASKGPTVEKISVRQLTSWKVALQKSKGQLTDIKVSDEGDTFFSTMPLQYNDFADIGLATKRYTTPEQDSHDRLIRFMRAYMIWITLFFTVLHIAYFMLITIRCAFSVPYSTTAYVIEWIVLEIPMMVFAVITDIAPKEYKGVYKVQTRVEVIKYLKSRSFISDVLGALPLDIIGFALGNKCSVTMPSICGIISPYWKLNRVLLARYAVFNTGDLMETLTMTTGYPPQVARLCLTFIYFFLTTHVTACVFNIYMDMDDTFSVSWLKDPRYASRSTPDQYFQSIDWAAKSMVGFTRGNPFNIPLANIIFILIVAFAGTTLFAILVAAIGALFNKQSPYEATNEAINLLYDDFAHRNLPTELRDEVRRYFWHLHDTVGKKDVVMDALEDLPKQLQVQLTLQIGRDMLSRVPLLAPEAHNNEFVLALTVALVPQIVHPFSLVFKKGDKGDSMAFVVSGSVAVVPTTYITTHDEENIYFLLKTGSFFGEIALILGIPRTATIASLSRFANLLVLKEDIFRQIAADFPSAVRRMRLEAECRLAALNQGPEALNRERARRLLEAITINRLRYAYHQWLLHHKMATMGTAFGISNYYLANDTESIDGNDCVADTLAS